MGKNYFSATPFSLLAKNATGGHNAKHGFVRYQKKRIEPLITEKKSLTKSDMRFSSYCRLKNCSRTYLGVAGAPFPKKISENVWVKEEGIVST